MAAVSHRKHPAATRTTAAAASAGQAFANAQQHRSQHSRTRQLQTQQQRAVLPASLARLMGCTLGPSSSQQQKSISVHASVPVASWRPGSIKQRIAEGLKCESDVPPAMHPAGIAPHAELSHKDGGPAEEGNLRRQQRRPRDAAALRLDLQRPRQLPSDSCAAPASAAATTSHAAAGAAYTHRLPAAQRVAHQLHLQPENAMQQPQQEPPDSNWRKPKRARTAAGPPRTPLGTKGNGASNGSVDVLDEIMSTTGCKRPAAVPVPRPAVQTLRLEAATTEGMGALSSGQRGPTAVTQAAQQKQHTAPAAEPKEHQPAQPHAAGAGDAEGIAAVTPAVRRPLLQATPWRRRKSSLDVPGVIVPLLPPLSTPQLTPAPLPPLQHNLQLDAETQPAEADDDAVVQQQVSNEHPQAAIARPSTTDGSLLYADSVPATQPTVDAGQHGAGPQQQHSADEQGMEGMMDAAPLPACGAAAAKSAGPSGMQQPAACGSSLQAAQHSVSPGMARLGMSQHVY